VTGVQTCALPIYPRVEAINAEYRKLSSLSNDELRAKTIEFKAIIAERLASIDEEIADIKSQTESEETKLSDKEALFKEIDKLKKDRDAKLEEVLDELLPQAFAVVKETARRFSENKTIEVTANDFDKKMATLTKPVKPITIQGDKAIWANSWEAAGTTVNWNMVH
jgi:preprotein translocase subunit SecA